MNTFCFSSPHASTRETICNVYNFAIHGLVFPETLHGFFLFWCWSHMEECKKARPETKTLINNYLPSKTQDTNRLSLRGTLLLSACLSSTENKLETILVYIVVLNVALSLHSLIANCHQRTRLCEPLVCFCSTKKSLKTDT